MLLVATLQGRETTFDKCIRTCVEISEREKTHIIGCLVGDGIISPYWHTFSSMLALWRASFCGKCSFIFIAIGEIDSYTRMLMYAFDNPWCALANPMFYLYLILPSTWIIISMMIFSLFFTRLYDNWQTVIFNDYDKKIENWRENFGKDINNEVLDQMKSAENNSIRIWLDLPTIPLALKLAVINYSCTRIHEMCI